MCRSFRALRQAASWRFAQKKASASFVAGSWAPHKGQKRSGDMAQPE